MTDFRALSPQAQEEIRRKTVAAVLGGKTQVEAAALFGVTRQAVGGWMKQHAEGGARALKAKPRGRPKGKGRLEPWQAAQTAKAITDRCPDQLKLPFWLWTREAVANLIERRYGISLSVWTVGRMLKHWGFTPQKPAKRAYEQNPKAVQKWLDETYPAIRTQAKRENAEIYWGDEMGLRSDHQTGTSYGRCGETPVIPGPGRRFGTNMLSAITNKGRLMFMVFRERFDTSVFLKFLRRFLHQAKRKVFLIIDSHPVHVSATVTEWIEKNKERIHVFFLPGYSPQLNPDELLNQDVKSNAVGRRRAQDQKELIANIRGYLRSTQKQPQVVMNYFQGKRVRYASMSGI